MELLFVHMLAQLLELRSGEDGGGEGRLAVIDVPDVTGLVINHHLPLQKFFWVCIQR